MSTLLICIGWLGGWVLLIWLFDMIRMPRKNPVSPKLSPELKERGE